MPVKSKIYLASSWRNPYFDVYVKYLVGLGHRVYNFRDSNGGFAWSAIDLEWESWYTDEWIMALDDPIARAGFELDFKAMNWCDTIVLLLPCGRSAHLELGWGTGAGKRTCIVAPEETTEPELMAKMVDKIVTSKGELGEWLDESN